MAGCIWYLLGTYSQALLDESRVDGWALREWGACNGSALGGGALADTGERVVCDNVVSGMDRYLRSVYWAFTTVSTVGYGDILP